MKATQLANRRLSLNPAEPLPDSAIWEPVPRDGAATLTSSEAIILARRSEQLAPAIEETIIAAATRTARFGETQAIAGDHRERELRSVFAALMPAEAFQVRRRLEADREGDPLVMALRRLTAERRARLLAFLASPRRGLRAC